MPYTRGFRDRNELRRHYIRHGAEFACATSWAYEERADAFLGGPLVGFVAEYTRPGSYRLRYNQDTHEFGKLSGDGYIVTYFIPGGNSQQKRMYFWEQCK